MKNVQLFALALLTVAGTFFSLDAQTPAQNKETAKKILAAVDAGDLNTFGMYVSANLVEHMQTPPGFPATGSDFERSKTLISAFHTGFPDSKTIAINVVAEGNLVTIHSRYTGTNTGSFMGMPATNKAVDIEQVDIIRFDAAGKGVEHWAVVDQLTMLQQMGLIPAGGN